MLPCVLSLELTALGGLEALLEGFLHRSSQQARQGSSNNLGERVNLHDYSVSLRNLTNISRSASTSKRSVSGIVRDQETQAE